MILLLQNGITIQMDPQDDPSTRDDILERLQKTLSEKFESVDELVERQNEKASQLSKLEQQSTSQVKLCKFNLAVNNIQVLSAEIEVAESLFPKTRGNIPHI